MSGATRPALRAVFFDLDDTLCDTIGTRPQRARRAFERLVLDHPRLDADILVARALEQMGPPRSARGVPRVLEELGVADTQAGRQAVDFWFFVGCSELLRPFPGVRETLPQLSRRYALGLVTNGGAELQRNKFLALRLDTHIRHVVISEEMGFDKPDPRIFCHALSLAGVAPGEAAFVGDRLDIDVAGAKAAGMRAVWFNHWGGALDDISPRPDAVIRRFAELPEVLERL